MPQGDTAWQGKQFIIIPVSTRTRVITDNSGMDEKIIINFQEIINNK
jgi:hypothetical protein